MIGPLNCLKKLSRSDPPLSVGFESINVWINSGLIHAFRIWSVALDCRSKRPRRLCPESPFLPAPPPDVRRGYASPFSKRKQMGLCPSYGLWPMNIGQSPNQGHSPNFCLAGHGKAEPCRTSGGRAALTDF